jgi:hypothetical protein
MTITEEIIWQAYDSRWSIEPGLHFRKKKSWDGPDPVFKARKPETTGPGSQLWPPG